MKSVKLKKVDHGLSGSLKFPGDKSLSHRAIIFGALAEGISSFTNVLAAEDCVCTREAFESMGVQIHTSSSATLKVTGHGLLSLKPPKKEIYLGNSGTSMRLLLGVLAGNPFEARLTGDASLCGRPMRRVTDYLRQMGARFEGRDNANFAPISVFGGKLRGIHADLPIPSAQVKSAILLAGLYAEGETSVTEPFKSRDHTERFLSYFGAKLKQEGPRVSLTGGQVLKARSFEIAGDISSAAFFMVMAAIIPQAAITFQSVLWNPTRTGIADVFRQAGAEIKILRSGMDGPEPTADFSVTPCGLQAFEIQRKELPLLIDEIPVLCVLATQAKGRTVIHEADELRVKETDRIASMCANLSKMGARIKAEGNTIFIEGPTRLHGARLDSFKDHRTAMSCIVAGMIAEGETTVTDLECINTSFPEFFELLAKCGVKYQFIDTP